MTKHIQKAAEGNEVLLTCQSEGYPESSVTWQDAHLKTFDASTTAVLTPDKLFKVTSELRVQSSERNNYTCTFKDGHSATFHIPGIYLLTLLQELTQKCLAVERAKAGRDLKC